MIRNIPIDFLEFQHLLKFRNQNNINYIWDNIRKKYIVMTPEESVRQLCVQWLIHRAGIRKTAIQIEKSIKVYGNIKRFDIVVYDQNTVPYLLIECKSPEISINQAIFDQLSVYQKQVKAKYLMVTNGITSHIFTISEKSTKFEFYENLPTDWGNI